ncbi:MAG: putative toxin-antitoxin system toxin component, PIN family [Candidatus Dormibacteria bacterium]
MAVVVDINVLVDAVTGQESEATFESWPSPPPVRGDPAANTLGVLNDAREFALWLSPHILDGTDRVLREYFGWSATRAAQYLDILARIAIRSGGATIEPDVEVSDCEDWEDNRILELAADSGAVLIVSSDSHLLDMSPRRGTPVVDPITFVSKVDAMRRAQGRLGRTRTTL